MVSDLLSTNTIKFPTVDKIFMQIKESTSIDKRVNKDFEFLTGYIRREWNLGKAPIDNLTRLLESKGVVISKIFLDDVIDGFSFGMMEDHSFC